MFEFYEFQFVQPCRFCCSEKEHLGRFDARDVGVLVPLQVTAHVHAEDAFSGAVREDGADDGKG